jgi:hypothetical protein
MAAGNLKDTQQMSNHELQLKNCLHTRWNPVCMESIASIQDV